MTPVVGTGDSSEAGAGGCGLPPESPPLETPQARSHWQDEANRTVVWQWEHRTGFRNYSDTQCERIEEAYHRGDYMVRLKSGKGGAIPMELFFRDMLQHDPTTGNTRRIQRIGTHGLWQRTRRWVAQVIRSFETGRPRNVTFAEYQRERAADLRRRPSSLCPMDSPPSRGTPNSRHARHKDATGICAKILRSSWFFSCSMSVILLNAAWIGIDAELNTPSQPLRWFRVVDQIFCFLFTAELCVHFGAFSPRINCLKDRWFCFDLLLVIIMIMDAWVLPVVLLIVGDERTATGFKKLGALRVLRLLRLSWLSRVLTHFPELMMLSKGILQAMRSVFFTLLMLLLLLFCFGVVFKTQVAEDTELENMFGTILGSMWVLLLHGTFLDSPALVLNTIGGESAVLAGFFLVFIFLSSFTVLNMLIGILCEVVSQVSRAEKEAATLANLSSSLLEILECYDARNDHRIRPHEFDLLFRNPDLHRILRRFGVDVDDLLALKDHFFEVNNKKMPCFDIPDDIDDFLTGISKGTSSWASSKTTTAEQDISFGDFMEVVMRLRGDNKATVTDIVELREYFGQRFANIDRILSAIIQLPAAQQQPEQGCQEEAPEETTEPTPQVTVQQQLAAIAAQVGAIGTRVEALGEGLAHVGGRVDTITEQLEIREKDGARRRCSMPKDAGEDGAGDRRRSCPEAPIEHDQRCSEAAKLPLGEVYKLSAGVEGGGRPRSGERRGAEVYKLPRAHTKTPC